MNEGDEQVLSVLVQHGADLSRGRNIRHYLYAPSDDDLEIAAQELRARGYEANLQPSAADDGQFLLLVEKRQVVNGESVAADRSLIEALVSRIAGAEYDGWESELLGGEVPASKPSLIRRLLGGG